MTSCQPLVTDVGRTHASKVIAVVSCSAAALGTVTNADVPLNDSAPPFFPVGVHVAFTSVPVRPFPEASPVVVPLPSSNPYAATSDGTVASVVALAVPEYGLRFVAASVART